MSFKSLSASALFRIVAAFAVLTGVAAVSAPAFAGADQVQAGQLSAQIVEAVRAARLNSDCQSWDAYRQRRDPTQSNLNRNGQAACPVCSRRDGQDVNPLCRIDGAAAAAELNSRDMALNSCRSCEAAVAAAIQGAVVASGASPQTAQAALAQAQVQLASMGVMDGSTSAAFASVTAVVNQQVVATGATIGGGAPGGPTGTNSISSPPSSSGGGGYVTH